MPTPSLSQLPSNVKRDVLIKSLKKLGFDVSVRGGKGSHYKATWPPSQKFVTIQSDLRKDVLYKVIKQIKRISGISWDDIKDNM